MGRAHAPIAALELRHPRGARAEDRVRATPATARPAATHRTKAGSKTMIVRDCGGAYGPVLQKVLYKPFTQEPGIKHPIAPASSKQPPIGDLSGSQHAFPLSKE